MNLVDAICTAPANGTGKAMTSDGWYLTLEILIASGGARVGVSKVGTARVSSPVWYDLTSSVIGGIEYTRGTQPTGQGLPRANIGVASFQLDNNNAKAFSAWHATSAVVGSINTAILNREFKAGAIVRICTYKPTASTSYSVANGVTSVTRTNWQPLFTGIVEDWKETIVQGNNTISVTLAETMSQLAPITDPALSVPVGAGDNLLPRISRLADAANWSFGLTQTGYWADFGATNYFTSTVGLAATNMSANRLAEVYLSGDSVRNTPIRTDRDGSL